MGIEHLDAFGLEGTEQKFEALLTRLSQPPGFTTVRLNTHLASVECIQDLLSEEIQKQLKDLRKCDVRILPHPKLPDVLLIPVIGPRETLARYSSEVIVGVQCGNAVLRGAHVFAPGIVSAPKFMKVGDVVSMFSDIDGKCTRGAMEFQGNKVFVGNYGNSSQINIHLKGCLYHYNKPRGHYKHGISGIEGRMFVAKLTFFLFFFRGIGIRMTKPVCLSPCFDKVLSNHIFLQNLPSVVVGHVLAPVPGERILDMCAAPGGKTTHIAALMHDQGEVIAMDKIANKLERIKQNAALLQLKCIKAYCFNGTKALATDATGNSTDGPPFSPESFDRILLDAPCSGLGQRPNMAFTWSLKEVLSYQPLQRKLFAVAVKLLKPGGVLVYSTCTITLAENEEQVAWALQTFECLRLQPQEPHLGGEGMMGACLSRDQLKQLQRFDPACVPAEGFRFNPEEEESSQRTEADFIQQANKDTIGFFIAKFVKVP
ncbi:tRNA (cytosine(72)-C(5))-methyltransferase NSUN6-like [Acipenser ruthenus]|uniref:tRNA (cytosine(72)-C(5))-methyltransferase NSUN6-like n=1 Tax=Acipenser ruthenus TaxID=7906 RepID=UPI0027424483|nr:tRNA (cytosine(72)-C(5))-methyltransferase NSUN6-like [Acipenser ruthenus]